MIKGEEETAVQELQSPQVPLIINNFIATTMIMVIIVIMIMALIMITVIIVIMNTIVSRDWRCLQMGRILL